MMKDYISPQEFDFDWWRKIPIQKRRAGNPSTTHLVDYLDLITAFDIETTADEETENSFMYIWQWQFGDKCTVVGRTWYEFRDFAKMLKRKMRKAATLVVFVHNLSYEFHFLQGIYNFSSDEVFAIDPRKVLKCDMYDFFEFRCSYLHSNMSLAQYTEKMGVKDRKLSGTDFDYNKKRYPWTELTDEEMHYCINDVRGLVEAIEIEMEAEHDNLYTFPLTSTGYVRRDAKREMRKNPRKYIERQLPNLELYTILREAFRGGNTHANRYYAGKIIQNVSSADRSSSYPEVLCNCRYPVDKFNFAGNLNLRQLTKLLDLDKAIVFRAKLYGVELRDKWWGAPYLSKDKSRNIIEGRFDNGRVLGARYLETTLTDIDLKIVASEYIIDKIECEDVYYTRYGVLPKSLIQLVCEYYRRKTELKGIPDQEIYYFKAKNKLNSIYGMMAQDPVKQNINYIGLSESPFVQAHENVSTLLDSATRRMFMPYQWGVWTTAHARYELERGIQKAGENFVYADTDSVKYVGVIDWSDYNKEKIDQSTATGAFATDAKNETHYMGVYEFEETYSEFVTLGAKKYCYADVDGKLHTTIAGVNKKLGGKELEKAGGIRAFAEGFTFSDAGGTNAKYNDVPNIDSIIREGRKIPITSNIYLSPSTYTLGITSEYRNLLMYGDLGYNNK